MLTPLERFNALKYSLFGSKIYEETKKYMYEYPENVFRHMTNEQYSDYNNIVKIYNKFCDEIVSHTKRYVESLIYGRSIHPRKNATTIYKGHLSDVNYVFGLMKQIEKQHVTVYETPLELIANIDFEFRKNNKHVCELRNMFYNIVNKIKEIMHELYIITLYNEQPNAVYLQNINNKLLAFIFTSVENQNIPSYDIIYFIHFYHDNKHQFVTPTHWKNVWTVYNQCLSKLHIDHLEWGYETIIETLTDIISQNNTIEQLVIDPALWDRFLTVYCEGLSSHYDYGCLPPC